MNAEVKILFFAKAREISGRSREVLYLPTKVSYEDLLKTITDAFSLQIVRDNIILAINEEYCTEGDEICLKTGDEIAVIPPLSGG